MNNSPKVGIGILIIDKENKVLLILRNSDAIKADSEMRLEGTWTLPAGKVKYGETIINAAKRKVKEEVNLDVDDIEIISVADDINEYAHYLTLGVIAHSVSGNVFLGNTDEHIKYDYFDINNLPDNLCFPSKKIILNYLNKKIY